MNTDRELLELAARAAGVKIKSICVTGRDYHAITEDGNFWSPLTDDGDAMRLAMKLMLNIIPRVDWVSAGFEDQSRHPTSADIYQDGPDFMRVTRIAIVRAAAEIGNAMP